MYHAHNCEPRTTSWTLIKTCGVKSKDIYGCLRQSLTPKGEIPKVQDARDCRQDSLFQPEQSRPNVGLGMAGNSITAAAIAVAATLFISPKSFLLFRMFSQTLSISPGRPTSQRWPTATRICTHKPGGPRHSLKVTATVTASEQRSLGSER